ncbi:MAG: hypothetical protein ACRDAM_13715, partial [Casimicrobium sp.]
MRANNSFRRVTMRALSASLVVAVANTATFANSPTVEQALEDSTVSLKWTPSAHLPPAPSVNVEVLAPFLHASSSKQPEQKANQATLTRAQVVNLYNTLYVPGNSASMGWSGSGPTTCNAGTTDATFRQRILDRINFYRQVAGLPTISFFSGADFAVGAAQASALMQGANSWNAVNPHSPPTT